MKDKHREGHDMAGKPSTELPEFMAQLFAEKGYASLWDAAKKSGVPYTTFVRYAGRDYENRGTWRSLIAAKQVADALGITLDELVAKLTEDEHRAAS